MSGHRPLVSESSLPPTREEKTRIAAYERERPEREKRSAQLANEFAVIKGGCFLMGSPETEPGRFSGDEPQHQVCVKDFELAKHEVTQGQWRAIMGNNPSKNKYCGDDCPVDNVSWNDAQEFLKKLSQKTDKTYRLPSDAEWEYAARAGTTTARPWGESPDQTCNHANVGDQTAKRQFPATAPDEVHTCSDGYANTAPAGSFRPNAFGMYDMLGNVWEWVEDCRNDNYTGSPADGSALTSGRCEKRVLRGGSWFNASRFVRSASRFGDVATERNDGFGFRPARTLR